MGRRLIIEHGKRVTRHEIVDRTVVIGRDPSCDLFFADQKLSRRHARIEPTPEGVKLIDLGSRNGSWVNEESVGECLLRPDDSLRLGSLRMSFEVDEPEPADREETVLFDGRSGSETVQLSTGIPSGATTTPVPPADDTVLFGGRSGESTMAPVTPPTVIGARVGVAGGSAGMVQSTRSPGGSRTYDVSPELPTSWNPEQARELALTQPILVLLLFALVAYLLVAFPLAVSARKTLREESLARGRSLLRLLSESNAPALADRRFEDVSIGVIDGEPGVKGALIMDPDGRVLAPPERAGGSVPRVDGIDEPVGEVETFVAGVEAGGELPLVMPITHEGQRVGTAVLTFEPPRQVRGSVLMTLLGLGLFLILGGAAAAFLLGRKRLRALSAVASEPTMVELP